MVNEKKTSAIRFEGFDGEWVSKKLNDFGEATSGTSIESEFSIDGRYKVISIGSYSENSVYTDQGIRVDLTDRTMHRVLNKNDLTMILNDKTIAGNIIGRVLLVDCDDSYVYNQRTQRIEPNHDEYEAEFLYQLLNAPLVRAQIVKQAQGNTQIYVNWSAICNTDYFIPHKTEQILIGNFFRNLDDTIALKKQQHEQTVNIKKAMLEKMFPKKGADVPQIRFDGFDGAWGAKTLGDITTSYSGGTPAVGNGEYYDGTIPFIRSAEISSSSTELFITSVGLSNSSAKMVDVGDILYALYGATSGEVGISKINGAINQAILCIKPHSEYDSNFIMQWLRAKKIDIVNYYLQGGQGNLSGSIVKSIEITIPSFDEQTEIGNFFCNLDTLVTAQQEELKKLQNIKKACLSKMFV